MEFTFAFLRGLYHTNFISVWFLIYSVFSTMFLSTVDPSQPGRFFSSVSGWNSLGQSLTGSDLERLCHGGTPLQYSCLANPMDRGAWWAAVHGVARSQTRLEDFAFTFHFHALEKAMATHSSVLAWRIPGTGQPGGLPSLGSHRVRHDWSDLAVAVMGVHNDIFDPKGLLSKTLLLSNKAVPFQSLYLQKQSVY